MRIVVLIFLGIIFTLQLYSQNKRITVVSIEAKETYNYLEDLKTHFAFHYSFGKHSIFTGFEVPNGNQISGFGAKAGYRFYPNRTRQVFDLFFFYEIRGVSRLLYENSTTGGFSLINLTGYGFNVYVMKNIYLTHNLALGIEKAWFGNQGDFTDLNFEVSIGVGFMIRKK